VHEVQSRRRESLGYESHLLLELSLERKNRKVDGQEKESHSRGDSLLLGSAAEQLTFRAQTKLR
jgi:hypothetical protein